MTDFITEATLRQQEAASPDSSVFVSANAGTGKTKVLTDRVLRLLISGALPQSILCMTFTKAAAVEMTVRLNQRLADWAVCDETKLIENLISMGEARPKQEQILRARALFAEIADTDDGPRIETVHAFCQSILGRFPIEAGIPPHFQLVTEIEGDQLLQKTLHELLQFPSTLTEALSVVAGYSDERQLFSMIKFALAERGIMRRAISEPSFMAGYLDYMAEASGGVTTPPSPESMCASLDMRLLEKLADDMMLGGSEQQKRGKKLQRWLSLSDDKQCQELSELLAIFDRKRLVDTPVRTAAPESEAQQKAVAEQLRTYIKACASALTYQKSAAFMQIATHIFQHYQALKYAQGVLDFDDLIEATDQMLGRGQMLDWVRWKLDSGIHHLLVDEAQDTSPAQWSLIAKLAQPFFEDDPEDAVRTLFAVGDFKQSIYRFQGANPDVFLDQRRRFHKLANQMQKPIRNVQFAASFRSAGAVLEFVDTVMQDASVSGIGADYVPHKIVHADKPSFVELWPVQTAPKPSPPPPFQPSVPEDIDTAAAKQAHFVADKIATLLTSGRDNQLGRIIKPSDIMILVRRRDLFYALLRAALIRKSIPVAPADRVKLLNQIEILDLLALGDVCLLPEDDLQLAALLKSPLFGLDDDDLMALAIDRKSTETLFDRLKSHDGSDTKLGAAAQRFLRWRDLADWLSPFEFYSHVLIAEGGKHAFYKRLGGGVMDTLDVFLSLARDHGREGGSGLSGFLRQIRDADLDLKRDMAATLDDQVRIMTIHGAKGLEAPIVILPDMLKPRGRTDPLVTDGNYLFWSHSVNKQRPAFVDAIRSTGGEDDEDELDRLLYVALTRAEQGLIIGGFKDPDRRSLTGSWYERLERIMSGMADSRSTQDGGLLLSSGIEPISFVENNKTEANSEMVLPSWFSKPPEQQAPLARPLNPSQPVATSLQKHSVANDAKTARLYGQVVHKLLEWLPDIEIDSRQRALARFFASQTAEIQAFEARITAEILSLLDAPDMAMLFSPDAQVEVPIVGVVETVAVSGQIDRLCISDSEIIVADFKTGAPPAEATDLSSYHRQLALYAALLSQIYPTYEISTYIIWTRTANKMHVSAQERKAALDRLSEEMRGPAS